MKGINMLSQEILDMYKEETNRYVIEVTMSSMCLDKHVEEEWNTLNMKCIDSAKLYKLVEGKPVLVKEK